MTSSTLMLIFSTALATAQTSGVEVQAPQPQQATTNVLPRLVLSAHGPGEGNVALAVGMSIALFVPMYEGRLLWNPISIVDLEMHARSAVVFNQIGVGARARLVGGEHFSVALRTGLEGLHGRLPNGKGGTASLLKPGIVLSTGNEDFQLTLEAHLPLKLGASGNIAPFRESEESMFVETSLGFEMASTMPFNFVGQITLTTVWMDPRVVPFISLGASF